MTHAFSLSIKLSLRSTPCRRRPKGVLARAMDSPPTRMSANTKSGDITRDSGQDRPPMTRGWGGVGARSDEDVTRSGYSGWNYPGRRRGRQHSCWRTCQDSTVRWDMRWWMCRRAIEKYHSFIFRWKCSGVHVDRNAARELRARILIKDGRKDNYTNDISRQDNGSSQEPRPLDRICWKCKRGRNNQADTEGGSTHVAVAANISCLFAFVHTLSAAANSSVNTIIRQIFSALCSMTKYKTTDDPTNKATMIKTKTRRTTISMRRLLYKCKWSSSIFLLCSSNVKMLYEIQKINACVRHEKKL